MGARFPCGKRGYRTAAEAWRAVREVRKHHGPRQQAYRCDCGKWHLTTRTNIEPGKPRPRRPRWEPPPRDEEEYVF